MYNSAGIQQMYNAQGSPKMYTPKGTEKPYVTPPLNTHMYSAQGNPVLVEEFNNSQPAFVSDQAKRNYWAERSARGYPLGASESENKVREKNAWVAYDPSYVPVESYPIPPHAIQDPTFAMPSTPTDFRGANIREGKVLEKPAYVPENSVNNTANKGCFYTASGDVSCPKK